MTKILVFLSISLWGFCCFGQQDTTRTFYANGSLKQLCMLDSLGGGSCNVYYQNGNVNTTQDVANHQANGIQKTYSKNQKLIAIENFKNGVLDDSAYYFYENISKLQLYRKGKYLDDFYEGEWLSYYPNGKLKQKGNYTKGDLDGIWFFFDKKGCLANEVFYVSGKKNGLYQVYHPKSHKCIEQRYYENDIETKKRKYFPKKRNLESVTF